MTCKGLKEYLGNYDLYLERKALQQVAETPKTAPKVNEYKLKKEKESEKRRLAGKIKRCETAIEEIEERICKVNELLTEPDVAADYEKVLSFTQELTQLKEESDELMAEWEELQSKAIEIGLAE